MAEPDPHAGPRRYFIGAATTSYHPETGLANMPELETEVDRVAELFTQLEYERVPGFGVNLPGEQLRRRLRDFLDDPARVATDVVVVYYTGHGYLDETELALPTVDTTKLAVSAVWANDLARLLGGTTVERILFIIDTCYSAVGGAGLTQGAIAFVNRMRGPVSPTVGVLVSARAREQAGPGAFPKALVEAVHHPSSGGHEPEFLPLDSLVHIVNANTPDWQHSRLFFVGDGISTFIPNPRYALWLRDLDLRTQIMLRQRAERDAEREDHVLPRARGQQAPGTEDLWLFTGRHRALEELCGWLRETARPATMIVTGDPGSGKSAVLSRLFVLADERLHQRVPFLHVLPRETVPPVGSISRFIHARGMTPQGVMEALAEACDVPDATTPGELAAALSHRAEPLVVVIDALDEMVSDRTAGTRRPFPAVDEVLGPLVRIAGRTKLRLLLGTRKNLLGPLGVTNGSGAADVIDLDTAVYADPASIRAYAKSCLVKLVEDSPYRHQTDDYLANVAAAIAKSAGKSFLVALITARSLALRGKLVDPKDPGWLAALPEAASDAMRDDLARRLGSAAGKARDLLLPLAYGQGTGLPWEDMWPLLARALSNQQYTNEHLDWLVDQAGYYVVESTSGHRSTYRLYHEALAGSIREGRDERHDHATIVDALIGHAPRHPDGQPDWAGAHEYTRTYLVNHAAASGRLDELVSDPRFLLAATPSTLLAALPLTSSHEGKAAADAYRRALSRIRDSPQSQHAAYLQLAARCARAPKLADAVSARGLDLAWSTDWASWRLQPPHQTLTGHTDPVTAVALGEVNGQPIAVSVGHDRQLRVWAPATGTLRYPPLAGHTDWVNSVAIGHIGAQAVIVSGGNDCTVRLWDAETGSALGHAYRRHTGAVRAVALGQIGGRAVVASAGMDRAVRVWDASTGADIGKVHDRHVWANAVAMGQIDGQTAVVSGGVDGTVRIWNPQTGAQIGPVIRAHGKPVNAIALGQIDGRVVIASGSADRTVALWDAATAQRIGRPLKGHIGLVNTVALGSLNGKPVVVTGSSDATVRVWDATTGATIGEPYAGHAFDVRSVAIGEIDGRAVVVSGSNDSTVRVWDASHSPLIGDPFVGHTGSVNDIELGHSLGRGFVVTAGADGTARVWDAATGTPIGEPYTEHDLAVTAVAVAEIEGRVVVVTGSADRSLRIWDVATRELIGDPLTGHLRRVTAVAVGQLDGRPVAVSGGDDMTVRLWDLALCAPIGNPMRCRTGSVETVAIGEVGGRTVVMAGGSDRTIRMWDAHTAASIEPVIEHLGAVKAMAIAEVDGRALVVSGGADRIVRVRDAVTGDDLIDPLSDHTASVNAVAVGVGDDQSVVVSGGYDATVRVRDLTTGRSIADPLVGLTGRVNALAVGKVNGRMMVASGSSDATVRVWEVNTNALVGDPYAGHTGRVRCVAVGVSGTRTVVVTGGDDRTVRLWDANRGTPVCDPLIGHMGDIKSVAVGQMGDRFIAVSGGSDRSLRVWDAANGVELGQPLTGHDLSVNAVALGRLGERTIAVSASEDRTVRLWDIATGSALGRGVVSHARAVRTVTIGQVEGETIVAGAGADRAVRVWDAQTMTPLWEVPDAHLDTVNALAFGETETGPVIVSGSADRTIRVWDAVTGAALGEPLAGHRNSVTAVSLTSVHGRAVLVSGSTDHTMRIWTPVGQAKGNSRMPSIRGWSAEVIDFATPLRGVALAAQSTVIVVGDLGVCSLRMPH